VKMGLKGKIFKFMSDILKTGLIISYAHRRNLPQPVAFQRDFFLSIYHHFDGFKLFSNS